MQELQKSEVNSEKPLSDLQHVQGVSYYKSACQYLIFLKYSGFDKTLYCK